MSNAITLSEACLLLRGIEPMSYHRMKRLVERGELQGGRHEGGRWWVDRADVEQYRRRRADAALPPAA